jgi:hypothetical protein
MSIRQTLFEFDPEINRLDSDRGSQEAQWTTVAVLRACSELTLFARFLSLVSGGVRRMFYLTFEIKHSPYHPYPMSLLRLNSYNKTNGAKSTLPIGPTFVK